MFADTFKVDKSTMRHLGVNSNSGCNIWEDPISYYSALKADEHIKAFARVFSTPRISENISNVTIGEIYRLLVECGVLTADGQGQGDHSTRKTP